MGRDLLIAKNVRDPSDSSEPEVHGLLRETGHYRPWEKIILLPGSALKEEAGHFPDGDHRVSKAGVSLSTSCHGSSGAPSLV